MLNKIEFKKPNFKRISEQGYYAVDMHIHSNYSDSTSKIKNIIRKATKRNFGIAITDHNEIKGSLKAMESEEVLVIPGIEISALEGFHVLLYFTTGMNYRSITQSLLKNTKHQIRTAE